MSQLNKINMMVFLQCINTPKIEAICKGKTNEVLNFCFTYPRRDLPDDGNSIQKIYQFLFQLITTSYKNP